METKTGLLCKRRKKVQHFDEPGDAHFLTFSCYIHNNPVRRGLVTRAEDWPWSSAAAWAGMEDVVLKIDRTLPTLLADVD
jgi:putative transposase